jgi:hypothetical protein
MMKKMTDYSMDDESWKTRSELIREYLKNNDLGEMTQVIEWNLDTADGDSAHRKRYWANIVNLFGMIENSPITPELDCDLPDEEEEEEEEKFENECPYCYYESNEPWVDCPACGTLCAGCSPSNFSPYFCDSPGCSAHVAKTEICRSCHEECPNCQPSGDDYYDDWDEDDFAGEDNYSHADEL